MLVKLVTVSSNSERGRIHGAGVAAMIYDVDVDVGGPPTQLHVGSPGFVV